MKSLSGPWGAVPPLSAKPMVAFRLGALPGSLGNAKEFLIWEEVPRLSLLPASELVAVPPEFQIGGAHRPVQNEWRSMELYPSKSTFLRISFFV